MKRALTASDGDEYWETHVKFAVVPPLRGTITSATINEGVSRIMLAMSDADTAEVTLIVHQGKVRVKSKPKAGAEIEFSGVAKEFTKSPFMLTFDAEIRDVRGLDTDQGK